jgi:polyisoprenoid-binding protein YceI
MSWKIDAAHSEIHFSVKHMMITTVRGRFTEFSGEVELDEAHPELTRVTVEMAAASIDTRNEQRDAHLRGPDFFNAAEYPFLRFISKRVEVIDKSSARLIGDLTIRDVTSEVVLDVEYEGQAKSPWGSRTVGFTASTKINRKNWGLNWNVALETGGWLVGEEIKIGIDLQLVEQVEQPAEEALTVGV